MALTVDDVRGIAAYARIALEEHELADMCAYLNDALALIEPIRSFDLEGVEPTFNPIGNLTNVVAPDVADAHHRALTTEAALANAASTRDAAFRVPSILGEGGGDSDVGEAASA